MIQMYMKVVYAQVCWLFCVLNICHCFSLFRQDHGFDPPPCGSHQLPVFNSLYACTETSTLEEILDIQTWTIAEEHKTLWRSARPRETRASYSIPNILTFWHKKRFLFSSGRNEVLKTMLTGSPALSFSLPDPARRPPAFSSKLYSQIVSISWCCGTWKLFRLVTDSYFDIAEDSWVFVPPLQWHYGIHHV